MAVGAALAVAWLGGCSSDEATPVVLVDYEHDEFATQFLRYFPDTVQARPGDTVTFRQDWTGEPHTVTLGTAVAPVLEVTRPLLAEYGDLPEDQVPEAVIEEYVAAESGLPHVWGEEDDGLLQSAAQPCLVAADEPLPEGDGPCEVRELGAFSGDEVLFNSGVIPYEGPGGNVFELELADDIAPGSYPFICLVHGSFHSGVLEVVAEGEPVESPRELAQRALEDLDTAVAPLEASFARAVGDGQVERNGEVVTDNFGGLVEGEMDGVVNEFIPAEPVVRVGEPVTWKLFGPHSISFDVPAYLPIVEFGEQGAVSYNERVEPPAGGAPDPGEPPDDPTAPWVIDGGTYDGDGFWSSGVLWSPSWIEYTLRFSAPGEYPFACLIHPPMVGVVRVEE